MVLVVWTRLHTRDENTGKDLSSIKRTTREAECDSGRTRVELRTPPKLQADTRDWAVPRSATHPPTAGQRQRGRGPTRASADGPSKPTRARSPELTSTHLQESEPGLYRDRRECSSGIRRRSTHRFSQRSAGDVGQDEHDSVSCGGGGGGD